MTTMFPLLIMKRILVNRLASEGLGLFSPLAAAGVLEDGFIVSMNSKP